MWQSLRFEPNLPQYCSPTNDFLYRFSSTFHTCVPTPLAFISTLLGILSIISWLFAQMPQIYKNYTIKSTSGLSIFFLVEWCLGDLSNLLGAIFTKQATWQMIVAGYYCLVDSLLVVQWIWYEHLQHGYRIRRVWPRKNGSQGPGRNQEMIIEGMPGLSRENSRVEDGPEHKSSAKDIKGATQGKTGMWRIPVFEESGEKDRPESPSYGSRNIHRLQASSSFPSPSPRTILFVACLISLSQASPLQPTISVAPASHTNPSSLEAAGTVLSWISTLLYLGSRLPQLYKNWARKSTAGLSAHLFIAAFFGNLFYSTSMLANPNLWEDAPAHGNHGWVETAPNVRYDWFLRALPFWLGAAGVLIMDAAVGVQFLMYGESDNGKVVVLEESGLQNWRWRRVSGWMRGWVPSFREPNGRSEDGERGPLLAGNDRNELYGSNSRAT